MPVDRWFWTNHHFVKEAAPPYTCPICHRGTLKLVGNVLEGESGRSIRHQGEINFEADHYFGAFAALFLCSNDYCGEYVSASGKSEGRFMGEDGDLYTVCLPRMFSPPLYLLPIPEECPKDVATEFLEAFKLYWSDEAGAINHLRKAVEIIMDHLKIPRRRRSKKSGKLVDLSLHARINLFRAKNPTLADRLEAVKWLGNAGSHTSDEVSKETVFDACDLLEDFIHEYFAKSGAKIVALTKRVIRRKGRLSRRDRS